MSELQHAARQSKLNPLFLPEILFMVLDYVSESRRDECNLAMTCKGLFECIMPRLWETVIGVEQLLNLIPGTTIARERFGNNKKATVTISNRLLAEPWERYRVYAPYVRSLYMYGFDSTFGDIVMKLHVHGLDILSAKRRDFEGLRLPNLEELNTRQSDTDFDTIQHLALFALLLSPSIKKLELRDYPRAVFGSGANIPGFGLGPESLSPSALLLVNGLAKSLPVSRAIALPPYYDCPNERMIESAGLGPREECLGWFERLPNLINLTHLYLYSCGISGGSGESLIVLGHLPHLEALEIFGCSGSDPHPGQFFQSEPLPIPSGLFPCLKSLHLSRVPSALFYYIWNSETMVSKLTDVFIHPDPMYSPITWNALKSRIIPLLGSKSPNLMFANVFVKVQYGDRNDIRASDLEIMFALLSQTSLSGLSFLVYDRLGVKSSYSPPFHQLFPRLKHLNLSVLLDPTQLRMIAPSFPNLQHLSVILFFENFDYVDAIDSETYEPASLQPILIHVRYFNHHQPSGSSRNPLKDNLTQTTRYFESIWPNVSYLGIDDGKCLHDYREFV